jgi:2-polyprenyl-3-methyl-5-hydroxy-6-metoxy-1,4-benzoquinol methylase
MRPFSSVAAHDACVLCGAHCATLIAERDRDGSALRTLLCEGCGLLRCDPMPDAATLDGYYREHYRLDYKRQDAPSRRHILRAGLVAIDRLQRLPALPPAARRALDVGAGGGEFAYLLARRSGLEVTGIEPNAGYAGHARRELGIDVEVSTVYDSAPQNAPFDLVTLFHVLEHLRDPVAALRRIASWMAPGGALVVEVPNIEATCQSPSNLFHRAHLYNFNPATLHWVGRRAGLQAVHTWTSADGGNVCVTFCRGASPVEAALPDPALLGANAQRVRDIRSRHTRVGHYLTRQPWLRAIRRLSQRLREARELRRLPMSAQKLLDERCGSQQVEGVARGPMSNAVT